MKNLVFQFLLCFLIILVLVMRGGCNLIPTLSDNCTCVTSKGIYSLFPLRRTGGKPSKYNPDVPGAVSKVTLECNNDSPAGPVFTLTNEDDMTFNLKSHCRCIDGCPPGPGPTIPVSTGSTTPSTRSGPSSTEHPVTPSNGTETPSSEPGDFNSFWELKILLPSLLGAFLVVVILSACLWRRLCIVQLALLCICFQCHEQITVRRRVERIVESTEPSADNPASRRTRLFGGKRQTQ